MKCSFCGHCRTGDRLPRHWEVRGCLVLCPECRRRRYSLRSITTVVVEPIGAAWQELSKGFHEALGHAARLVIPDQARRLTIADGHAVGYVSIGDLSWALRLDSARWSRRQWANYRMVLSGEAVVSELLLYRASEYSPPNSAGCTRRLPRGIVCRMVAWLPRTEHQEISPDDPGTQEQCIESMELNRLRGAIHANRVSFPSQVPTFPGCHQPDLQRKLAQLYFVMGWSCSNIAGRYRLIPQQVRQILNEWKQRAAKAGYIQDIPPAEVVEQLAVAEHEAASEEHRLILDLQAGNLRVWEEMIERFRNPVYNLACRLLNDRDAAAKVAETVFLKIFRNARRFSGDSSLRTLVYRVAVKECQNRRSAAFGQRRRETWTREKSAEPGEAWFLFTANPEAGNLIERALSGVPPVLRTVLVLREIEEMSYEQIADVLEVSIQTVQSRIAQARETLRRDFAALAAWADSRATGLAAPLLAARDSGRSKQHEPESADEAQTERAWPVAFEDRGHQAHLQAL